MLFMHVKSKNKDLLLQARVVVKTSNMKISRRRLPDYVKTLHQKACRTCSAIIFLHSTNQVIDLWRFRWRCRRQILNSLISCEIQFFTWRIQSSGFARSEPSNIKLKQGHKINATQLFLMDRGIGSFGFAVSSFFRWFFLAVAPQNFEFSVLVTIAVSSFCSISLSVFGFWQK